MSLSPPRPKLPPLNALRAAEAAARHASFLRAAEELSVTPGAVAQQVRKLEEWAGQMLFHRHPQGISVTPLAAQLLPELTAGFERLGNVARTLRQAGGKVPVRIATLPAVAQLWLGPRLTELQDRLVDVELSVHALDTKPELTHGDFDLTLYPDQPEQRGHSRPIAENALLPVAAPIWADRLQDPEDLADAVLIHDLSWADDWRRWLDSQGLETMDHRRGPTYSLYSLAVERCIAGDGVLVGHTALLAHPLADGRLVAPFPDRLLAGNPICLTTPAPERTPSPLTQVIDSIVSVR